jgi:hypothetical protein
MLATVWRSDSGLDFNHLAKLFKFAGGYTIYKYTMRKICY